MVWLTNSFGWNACLLRERDSDAYITFRCIAHHFLLGIKNTHIVPSLDVIAVWTFVIIANTSINAIVVDHGSNERRRTKAISSISTKCRSKCRPVSSNFISLHWFILDFEAPKRRTNYRMSVTSKYAYNECWLQLRMQNRISATVYALEVKRSNWKSERLIDWMSMMNFMHFILQRKLEEHHAAVGLHSDAKELDNALIAWVVFLQIRMTHYHLFFSDIMNLYADALDEIVQERLETDSEIEKKVLDAFSKFHEQEKGIVKTKEKLTRTVLDMESTRKRLATATTIEKEKEIQDEYEAIQSKLNSLKVSDVVSTIYSLFSIWRIMWSPTCIRWRRKRSIWLTYFKL